MQQKKTKGFLHFSKLLHFTHFFNENFQGISYANLASLPPIVGLCEYFHFLTCFFFYFSICSLFFQAIEAHFMFDLMFQTRALFLLSFMPFLEAQETLLLDLFLLLLLYLDQCLGKKYLQPMTLSCFFN